MAAIAACRPTLYTYAITLATAFNDSGSTNLVVLFDKINDFSDKFFIKNHSLTQPY